MPKKRKADDSIQPEEKKEAYNKREVYWVFGIMAIMLLFLFVTPYVIKQLNTISYHGLTFTKIKDGKNIFYHYYYYFHDTEGQLYKNNLYLRKDPRLNEVPVSGEIDYVEREEIYLSINGTNLASCPNSMRDTASLAGFLANNLFNVKSGTPDKSEAEENNLRHISCELYPDKTVIMLKAGDKTEIVKEGKNCFVINVANCELLDAVEKYQVQSIIDAKLRGS